MVRESKAVNSLRMVRLNTRANGIARKNTDLVSNIIKMASKYMRDYGMKDVGEELEPRICQTEK